jgi:hypothetical protein
VCPAPRAPGNDQRHPGDVEQARESGPGQGRKPSLADDRANQGFDAYYAGGGKAKRFQRDTV